MSDIIGYGGGKGGGSSHTHYEAPDSLHSTSYARVLDLVSEGEILGLANGVESVFLNGTPVQNANGTPNFAGVTVDFRTGTQDQDFIPGFPDVESEVSVGVELKFGTPWVRAIGNTELSAVRITLGVDQLYKADTSNGDVGGSRVDYRIELSTDGAAYQTVLSNSFSGKTMSAYQRSARIDLPRATSGWQIRVSRLTPDSSVVNIVDKTRIISFTEVIDAKLRYPMSAIVGIQVDAKAFQSVPTRAYDMFGRIIQVPSNYNPVTRVYIGVWDGTFKPAWSDNPAWVFRDLALHLRYGLGDRITAAQLDKWSLYRIAQYCDQMVPNGKGGTEPRFTCNLYLQTRKQAYAVLQDIASIFRGISYWGGGTIIASADMPTDPVYVYTAANVIGGKFTRAGSSKGTRFTTAVVTWNDPADFYKPKVEYVEDPEGIKRYGIQQTELTAFGCTSQGQAQRAGRWALATSRLETEALSFDVGMDGAIALPGQIVRIADPSRMGRRTGGRIHSATGRTVVLDKAPLVKAGDNLTVILPTGQSETRAVQSVAGDSVTVTLAWSVLPQAQSVWSVDSTELSAPLFRVLSVAEKDETTFSIAAIQHETGKFDFVENGTAIVPRTQTALDVSRQAPPASVTLAGYTVSLDDVQKLALQVSCAPVPGAVAYEGAYRRGSDNWVAIPRQPSPTLDVQDVLPGSFVAKMAAVNSIGVTSVETLSVAVEIAKDGASKNADVLLTSDAPGFHTNQAGETTPGVITFSATLIALTGPVTWSCVGGTLTNKTATTAQLTFANMSAASAEVTASVTSFGRTYARPLKVGKSRDGAAGADGLKTQVARLFQWAPVAPAKPTGVSTFIWASLTNSGYTGQDGWANPAPANPGTPGWRLFAAAVPLSAAVAAITSPVAYTNAVIEDGVQNGAKGLDGLQSYEVAVFQWAATIPAGPVGTGTLTWAGFAFGAAPANWSLTPGTSPSPGYTLWKATVRVTDSAATAATAFNWGSAAITAAGSAGLNGSQGVAMYVEISTTGGQVFSRANAAAVFAPASITLTATPYGGAASAHQWQYWTGAAWVNIAGATSATYAVDSGTFTAARVFRVQSTMAGTVYLDEITLVQVTGGADGLDGDDAIVGFLTNESTALAATSAGVVSSFDTAGGTFKVYQGTADKTGAGVAYSVFSEVGCDVSITSAGAYSVVSMSADQAAATLQAVYGGVTIQKQLSLSKARAGTSITGAEGASYVTAYCASTTASTSTAPAPTAGKTSVPAANSGGLAGTYTKTVPALAAGQFMYQTDGIYNPANDTVTWSIPYWSSLKVGTLSAIVANLGQITGGSIDIGTGATSWHVDAAGNQWAGAGTFAAAPFRVANTGAARATNLVIAAPGGPDILTPTGLQPGFEAPGTKNSEAIAAAAADAATKAEAARVAAVNAAATYAQAQAGLAATNAAAYADGKVSAEEARAIADAAAKAEAARVAAVNAAAADATAKANVAATKSTWAGTAGRPDDGNNLLRKSRFDDGQLDGWANGSYVVNVDGQPFTKALQFTGRDCLHDEGAAKIPVTPGETLYFDAYIDASTTPYSVRFGAFVYDRNGTIIWYASSLSSPPGSSWAQRSGYIVMPAGAYCITPWLQIDGGSNFGSARASNLRISRFQSGATMGAPAGTKVGDTEAQTVVGWAYSGLMANNALPDKVSKSAANIMTGAGALISGSLTVDANGYRSGGYGCAQTQRGWVSYNQAGNLTFQLDAAGGAPWFAGQLSAAYGSFGAITFAQGGYVKSANAAGFGQWPGGDLVYLSAEGLMLGNFNVNRFLQVNANGDIYAPGLTLLGGQLTLTSPIIISPTFAAFTASLSGGPITSSGANGSRSLGSRQIIGSGGKLPYRSFSWTVTDIEGSAAARTFISGESTDTVSVSANGTNASTRVRITGTITDANGLTASASFTSTANFGSI
ncbi:MULTISPECIES: phage tail protein [unclassified Massilia]|uniref:TipJ family phage tail tip protein n=1 Tax=unclassified Massilia TaxID=2609279 RepID=UPI0017845FFD|nr:MULTISPECIES: phage tail protein [unclassified Massilia]MBD8531583.1 host specificity protein J [Massilia sp. CFBP 13647]MBD8673621.1 host specificity protein J [Massilia sp. CFBP 13721]